MLSFVLALLAIVGGIIALVSFAISSVGQPLQRSDILLAAIALFMLAGALGIWHLDGVVSDHLEDQTKK